MVFLCKQFQRTRSMLLYGCIGTIMIAQCGVMISCHAVPAMDDRNAKDLLRTTESSGGFVIGERYQDHLEYLDATTDYGFHSAPLSGDMSEGATTLDLTRAGQKQFVSSDSKWTAKCSNDRCELLNQTFTHRAIWISRKSLLTPLFWSPDHRLVFYIVKGPTWRTPARCSMEDERDIVLADLASGKQGVVRTVCGGFPYERLRWFTLRSRH